MSGAVNDIIPNRTDARYGMALENVAGFRHPLYRVDLLRRHLLRVADERGGTNSRLPCLAAYRRAGKGFGPYVGLLVAIGKTSRGLVNLRSQIAETLGQSPQGTAEETWKSCENIRLRVERLSLDDLYRFLDPLARRLAESENDEERRAGEQYLRDRGIAAPRKSLDLPPARLRDYRHLGW